ncbi:hypothetical protein [Pontibacter beigongshangensis]|uniref:hypothetical protein n=1 Tax=Pontibacter beigongshangensis TaxID=2574733 RepID=UPI00164F22BA|nr:hypothetical protein [Pontibacter beigongshangensis]
MNQSLLNTILFALAFVAMVIGIHKSIETDIATNYWIFMVSLILFMVYRHRKKRNSA